MWQVLRGGSRMVDFYIKDVHSRVIDEQLYKSEGSFKYTVPETGKNIEHSVSFPFYILEPYSLLMIQIINVIAEVS